MADYPLPCREIKIVTEYKTISDAPMVGTFFMPMVNPHPQETRHVCELTVFVQGELDEDEAIGEKDKLAVLSVHDVGSTAESFVKLANSPQMAPIRERSMYLHVCVPGQEVRAEEFDGNYPTMDQIAEMLPQVLDHFAINKCVAIGEGAGADIVCRFALDFPDRLSGLVLVHCTSVPHGMIANLRETLANLRLEDGKMNSAAWNYLLGHKFGHCDEGTRQQFIEKIRSEINEYNLSRFLCSFCNREEFTKYLKERLAKVDTVLVTGGKSPHNKNVFHMYDNMSKEKTVLLVAENASDVLKEAPEYILQALVLLCQRHMELRDSIGDQQSFVRWELENLEPEPELPKGPRTPLANAAPHSTHGQADVIPPVDKKAALLQFPSAEFDQKSDKFECKYCGKECCWCNDIITPGSPID